MPELIELASNIVAAYVSHNAVVSGEVPGLIGQVYARLKTIDSPQAETVAEKQAPAVSVKASLKHDKLTCLYCGKPFQSIRRHLSQSHGVKPDEYRAAFGLPGDYPMVAPNYSDRRSKLAKANGLGSVAEKAEPAPEKAKRGRPRKVPADTAV